MSVENKTSTETPHPRFVALLDVLGFTSLIAGERAAERLEIYQGILRRLLEISDASPVEAVVFSDSIVLTTEGLDRFNFDALASFCADLFGSLLCAKIPVRGSITAGSVLRATMGSSVFVAGPPVLEAHKYEIAQNWVGIMIAPSARRIFPKFEEQISLPTTLRDKSTRDRFLASLLSRATVQRASIPFHGTQHEYQGYAIVPLPRLLEAQSNPASIYGSITQARDALIGLQDIAPDPDSQLKYKVPLSWLANIEAAWLRLAQEIEREPDVG